MLQTLLTCKSSLFCTLVGILVSLNLFAPTCLGNITKVELRTQFSTRDTYVVFCSSANSRVAFVGLVAGDVNSGFKWELARGRYLKKGVITIGSPPTIALDGCVNDGLTSRASVLIAAIDSSVYSQMPRQFGANQAAEDSVLLLATAAGLKLGLSPSSKNLAEQIEILMEANALPAAVSRLASDWQPPIIRNHKTLPSAPECGVDMLATRLDDVRCVKREALLRLYQALADVESRPWIHYDLQLFLVNDTVLDIVPLKTRMRRDSPTKYGNIASVYVVQTDVAPVKFLELLDRLLILSRVASNNAISIDLTHPLVGTPETWMSVPTSPAMSYWALGGADTVGEAPSFSNARFMGALIRSPFARYPADPPVFNVNVPMQLSSILPRRIDLTRSEAKWMRYKAGIDMLQNIIKVRASSYPSLDASAIGKREIYRKAVANQDMVAAAVRDDFTLREIGWDEYLNNKLFGIREEAIRLYGTGRAALYATAMVNARETDFQLDISARTTQQLEVYKKLASDSYVGKVSSAIHFNERLPIWGTRCGDADTNCNTRDLGNSAASLELTLGDKMQRKFNNVLDFGRVTTAMPQTDSGFGTDPGGICHGGSASGNDVFAGKRSAEIQVMNHGDDASVRLFYSGSRVEAHWVTDEMQQGDVYALQRGKLGKVRVEFFPSPGVEDLNIIYLVSNAGPLATITIDYSQTDDSRFRMIELDSGSYPSAFGKAFSGQYAIGIGPPPLGYSFLRACLWLTGDRKCNEFSTCSWKQHDSNAVLGQFSLQGHEEGDTLSRGGWSQAHLRAVFELKADIPTLR